MELPGWHHRGRAGRREHAEDGVVVTTETEVVSEPDGSVTIDETVTTEVPDGTIVRDEGETVSQPDGSVHIEETQITESPDGRLSVVEDTKGHSGAGR